VPLVALSVQQIDKGPDSGRDRQNDPVLCYVYLSDKIQDVRGLSKEETRIKINQHVKMAENG